MIKKIKKNWPLLIVIALSFFSIRPLLKPGFFPIHDDTQVVRVQQMTNALKDGQFPVRWVKDLGYGYGYPIFNFYAPLPYYVGALFHLVGFNALTATKAMMALGVILAGIFMYFLAREIWGDWGGVVAALFYTFAPYHALDIYVRGAVGEFWAMAFLPLLFLGLYRIYQGKGYLTASLSFAAVILSHNLTALMAAPFLLFVCVLSLIFSQNKKLFIIHNSLFLILSLGLSAFYWLPALAEKNLIRINEMISQTKTWDHLVYWDQFWASPWGFAGSALGRVDGMSFMVGKPHLIFSLLSLIVANRLWQKRKKTSFLILIFNFLLLVSLFLSSQSSAFIWKNLRSPDVLQYPWRFLIFATLFSSLQAGSITAWLKKSMLSYLFYALIILFLFLFNLKLFSPQTLIPATQDFYINEENIKWHTSKVSDEYLPSNFPVPQSKEEVAWEKVNVKSGQAEIKNLVSKSHRLKLDLQVTSESEIIINTVFFPGWQLKINGKEVDYGKESDYYLDNHKPRLFFPPGRYQIIAYLTNTPLRTIANLISLTSWVGLGGFTLLQKKKKLFAK